MLNINFYSLFYKHFKIIALWYIIIRGDDMKTIKEIFIKETIVKNSRFITVISPLNNEKDVNNIIDKLKSEYKNATHYCYAYIISDIKRFNDDGEPGGTAGIPILNVLEKNGLNSIICIVIRYFGGIKLGAGGLIRAYGKSVREALKESNLLNMYECSKITIRFSYGNLKDVDFIINKAVIINKEFESDIKYIVMLKENELDIIDKLKLNNINIIDIKKDYYFE